VTPEAIEAEAHALPSSVDAAAERAREILADVGTATSGEAWTVAKVLRLSRRFELAAELYGLVFDQTGDFDALFLRAQQLAQLGEFEQAGRLARRVVQETPASDPASYELKRRAYALMARTLFYRGRLAEAERLLETLAALDDEDLVEVDALLLLASIESSLDKEPLALAQLERLFPTSLALELSAGRIQPPSTPAMLLGNIETEATGPSEHVPARNDGIAPDSPIEGVQVGSFSDPDNAHHMARDIEALGLDAEVREQTREGRSIQVVVALVPDADAQGANEVLSTLRDAGFDGFLIY
jgi:tetratricopeptide (TPR) repeat protein